MSSRSLSPQSSNNSNSSFSELTNSQRNTDHLKAKKGPLKKKGFWSTWKEGFFVLEGNLFLEFKNEHSSKPSKVIKLEKFNVKLADSITGFNYSFALISTTQKDPIFFCAANEPERVEWVTALNSRTKDGVVDWGVDTYLEAFNDPVVQSSERGVILGCNEAFLSMFGYNSKSEVIGRSIEILMPDTYAKSHSATMNRYAESGIKRLIGKPRRLPMIKADGSEMMGILSLGEVVVDGVKRFIGTMRKDETMRESMSTSAHSSIDEIMIKSTNDIKEVFLKSFNEMNSELESLKSKNRALQKDMKRYARTADSADLSRKRSGILQIDTNNIQIQERIAQVGGSGASIIAVTIDGWGACMKELDISDVDGPAIESFESEIEVLESLPYHRNLVRYLFHTRSESKLRLFMTRYAGNLNGVIKSRAKEKRFFKLKELIKFAMDIAKGMEVLHSASILHRDLKSDNIFVMYKNDGSIDYLSIGDFDTAKVLTEGMQAKTTVGTIGYISPEILKSRNSVAYSYPSDVWSYGMVLYELMTLSRPFTNSNQLAISELTLKGELPVLPEEALENYEAMIPLWKQCLAIDPSKRPKIGEIKNALLSLKD